MCMYVYMYVYVLCVSGALKGQKISDHLELELQMIVSHHWVLGTNVVPLGEHQVLF